MPNDPFIEPSAIASLGPVRYLDARDAAAFAALSQASDGARIAFGA